MTECIIAVAKFGINQTNMYCVEWYYSKIIIQSKLSEQNIYTATSSISNNNFLSLKKYFNN